MSDEPKRRWFSFSVRTLFALMTVGAALTFAGLEHQRANLLEVENARLLEKLSHAVEAYRNERVKSANATPFPLPREGTAPMPNLRPLSGKRSVD